MESVFLSFNLILLAGFLCRCVMASDWPEGYYGLPMAKTGCPDRATWETGWIFQDTEDSRPASSKSDSFHIEGLVKDSSVNRSFCIKNYVTNDNRRPIWPAGTYCIHQRTTKCPLGFRSGSIQWDDENTNNKNNEGGSLPKVDLRNSDTLIYFCCRNDGRKTTPIDLPTASPFYLFAYISKSCQQVKWAVSTLEWIDYDTEDYQNHDIVTKPAPYNLDTRSRIEIYYCYYTSCQYTLNASTGSIQFPRSGRNYANGQQCSWIISVKASQIIRVHITFLYLSDINDQVIFYDGTDAAGPLVVTLHGATTLSNMDLHIQSSSSNLFLLFRTNNVGSSSGFEATYSAIGTPITYPPPTSSTIPPPTTTITAAPTTTITAAPTTTITAAPTTTETKVVPDTPQKTDKPGVTSSSRVLRTTPTSEPSHPNGNSSKNYEMLKKTCVEQSQTTLTAVAIVIPIMCILAVIAMAGYLFFRLRTLREKPNNVSVRYSPESVTNPAYVPSDAVIESRVPSTSNAYEDDKGDIYHEIESNRQATDNPLYQSTDTDADTNIYASFA